MSNKKYIIPIILMSIIMGCENFDRFLKNLERTNPIDPINAGFKVTVKETYFNQDFMPGSSSYLFAYFNMSFENISQRNIVIKIDSVEIFSESGANLVSSNLLTLSTTTPTEFTLNAGQTVNAKYYKDPIDQFILDYDYKKLYARIKIIYANNKILYVSTPLVKVEFT